MVPRFMCILSCIAFILGLPMIGITSAFADDAKLSDEGKKERIHKIYRVYKKNFPEVTDISVQEALALARQQEAVFFDVRKPEERAVSMISGAITEKALKRDPSLIEGKTVVAYCTIGYRSGIFAEKMGIRGTPVSNLAGGILAWLHAGGKVYDAKGETKRVHVYGKKWDYAPQSYETVAFSFWEMLSNW